MKKIRFIFGACFLLVTFCKCYAGDFLEYGDFLQLYEAKDSSIIERKGNRFYLDPSRVSVSESGNIYLYSDLLGAVPIPHLIRDHEGLHTLMFCTYICNKCGAQYSSQPSTCSRVIDHKTGEKCGGSSFTVVGLLPD